MYQNQYGQQPQYAPQKQPEGYYANQQQPQFAPQQQPEGYYANQQQPQFAPQQQPMSIVVTTQQVPVQQQPMYPNQQMQPMGNPMMGNEQPMMNQPMTQPLGMQEMGNQAPIQRAPEEKEEEGQMCFQCNTRVKRPPKEKRLSHCICCIGVVFLPIGCCICYFCRDEVEVCSKCKTPLNGKKYIC